METITDPYALAEAGLCHYSGDASPLDHDGAWYASSFWHDDGYANCVRVTCLPDGPDTPWARAVIIELLTINKPEPKQLAVALESTIGADIETALNELAQIEACMQYGHYDPNHSDWRNPQAHHLVVVEDDRDLSDDDADAINRYCRIHGAKMATEATAWGILADWVGRHSCRP